MAHLVLVPALRSYVSYLSSLSLGRLCAVAIGADFAAPSSLGISEHLASVTELFIFMLAVDIGIHYSSYRVLPYPRPVAGLATGADARRDVRMRAVGYCSLRGPHCPPPSSSVRPRFQPSPPQLFFLAMCTMLVLRHSALSPASLLPGLSGGTRGLGAALGTLAGGYVIDAFGSRTMYQGMAIVMAINCLLFVCCFRDSTQSPAAGAFSSLVDHEGDDAVFVLDASSDEEGEGRVGGGGGPTGAFAELAAINLEVVGVDSESDSGSGDSDTTTSTGDDRRDLLRPSGPRSRRNSRNLSEGGGGDY